MPNKYDPDLVKRIQEYTGYTYYDRRTPRTTPQHMAMVARRKQLDPTFYQRIGRLGGSAKTSKPKGFATMTPEARREAARKGGIAKRTRKTR